MNQDELLAFLAEMATEDPKPEPDEIIKRLQIRDWEKTRDRLVKKHNQEAHDAYVAWIQTSD